MMSRPTSYRETDASALRAIAQAAVNVELFTIPLYMVALYSIQGMHQINAKDNDFYRYRLWPGAATSANPKTANDKAFNLIFSVFIEEMLHLQLTANIASAMGVTPIFTSPVLQNEDHGWLCYGSNHTVIPHIIDLQDTVHTDVTVTLAALTEEQVSLFQVIEEPTSLARSHVNKPDKYFPEVPFDGWTAKSTEDDLPMFGTIDHMYECYYAYMTLTYDDGTNLWQYVFTPGSQQNDLFNHEEEGHPKREFGGFRTTITAAEPLKALTQVLAMMNAITDQGEGSTLDARVDAEDLSTVQAKYQASRIALEVDYPEYSDTGQLMASADATARFDNGGVDHYERFSELIALLPDIVTWPMWHREHGPWVAEDLQIQEITEDRYKLPTPQSVADAMNRIAAVPDAMYPLFSKAAVGSIAGVTTVLDQYWSADKVVFPYPSMTGSADRLSTCWALFGQPPDLSLGIGTTTVDQLYHGCQGLDVERRDNACPAVEVYHSCRGSNGCQFQGGCGFVQPVADGGGGGSCGFALVKAKTTEETDGTFSAPSANKCATYGGCAVPMSASQLLVQGGTMQLYSVAGDLIGTTDFYEGEKAHDVAYRAYLSVMEHYKPAVTLPVDPAPPSDIRLVFPPST